MTFAPAAVNGEGIAFVGADRAQAAGFDGAGVSIAIFDWSFAGYPDRQASGDLPASVLTRAFCASGLTGGTGHGTAVAEIVHEIAPAAELHLVCINSIVELGRATDYAIDHGVDVINMSGGFYNSGDGAGTATGAFAELPDGIARKARDNGIVWVNASGNEALTHWSGTLADPDEDGVLDFAAGDEGNSFLVGAGRTVCAYARWRAWAPAGFSDFDLYVTSASGAVVAAAEADQPGSDPTEEACFTNAGPTQFFSAALVHRAGDATPLIDLFVPGAGDLEHVEPRGSLIEPAASPSVLAVGAVCRHTGLLQPYSSRGRETGPVKPDLVAPDAVSNATAGASGGCSSGFTGTSAAAPHVAGTIALLKDQFPGSTASQLEGLARAWARDVGKPNEDLETGFGIARLVTDAPAVAGSTAFPLEGGVARGTARVTSSVPGTVRWQYGPSTGYGSESAPLPLASSPAGVDVTDVLQFVPPGTDHARIVATNAYGTTFGPDEVFVAPTGPPSVGTLPAQALSAVGATLGATASANGTRRGSDFELGTTTAYGISVARRLDRARTRQHSDGGDAHAAARHDLSLSSGRDELARRDRSRGGTSPSRRPPTSRRPRRCRDRRGRSRRRDAHRRRRHLVDACRRSPRLPPSRTNGCSAAAAAASAHPSRAQSARATAFAARMLGQSLRVVVTGRSRGAPRARRAPRLRPSGGAGSGARRWRQRRWRWQRRQRRCTRRRGHAHRLDHHPRTEPGRRGEGGGLQQGCRRGRRPVSRRR